MRVTSLTLGKVLVSWQIPQELLHQQYPHKQNNSLWGFFFLACLYIYDSINTSIDEADNFGATGKFNKKSGYNK